MNWIQTWRNDPRGRALADRHYSRQKIGSPGYSPPGRVLVLLTDAADALWITSWPYAQYVNRDWPDAWLCTLFRNEGPLLSSDLIHEAVAVTRWKWPDVPLSGFITFIDRKKVRKKRDWGRCYRKAGWWIRPPCPACDGTGRIESLICLRCAGDGFGYTIGGLLALMLPHDRVDAPAPPRHYQPALFEVEV